MTTIELLRKFAANFVLPDYRDRFVHDATKRPEKLDYRISHHIESVFDKRFAGGSIQYDKNDLCLILVGARSESTTTWADAEMKMEMGMGLLVIDANGEKFYAETEGGPRTETYAGNLANISQSSPKHK